MSLSFGQNADPRMYGLMAALGTAGQLAQPSPVKRNDFGSMLQTLGAYGQGTLSARGLLQNQQLTGMRTKTLEDALKRNQQTDARRADWEQAMDPQNHPEAAFGISKQTANLLRFLSPEAGAKLMAGQNTPSNVKEWLYYRGLQPDKQQEYLRMKRAQPPVNLGGSMVFPNPTNPAAPPTAVMPKTLPPEKQPGNIEAAKIAEGMGKRTVDLRKTFPKARSALQALERKSTFVNNTIDRALATVSPWSTGYGALTKMLPNSEARKLDNYLQTIKANIGFDELTAMRQNSPSGGALGAVSEMENRLLQAVNGALDPYQRDQLVENLKIIKELYPKVLAERKQAFESDYGAFLPQMPQTPQIPQNITPEDIRREMQRRGLK